MFHGQKCHVPTCEPTADKGKWGTVMPQTCMTNPPRVGPNFCVSTATSVGLNKISAP